MRFLIALLALTCAVCAQVWPNIVVILADDLGSGTLGCSGNKEVSTTHIDQLAASGIRLTDFHSNGAMCSPTRASFHPMNYGFDEFRGYFGGNVDYHTHLAGYGLKEVDWWKDRTIQNEHGYTTDLLTQYATDFIERNKEKPFFLFLAHEAPHEPLQGRVHRRA